MVLIDGLCQCYHWSLQDAVKLTLPQIIMLNHGAWVNQQRAEERAVTKKDKKAEQDDLSKVVKPEDLEGFMAEQWGMVI